jgi:flagellar hook protein FlgE
MGLFDIYGINSNALNGQSKNLKTTGDNLANAGTTAFKKSSSEFAQVLTEAKIGKDGGFQHAGGTQLLKEKRDMTQGELLRSDSALDLGISGEGFIAVEIKEGERAYTRDGSLHFNKDGYLVTSDNYKVLGFKAGPGGNFVNAPSTIQFIGNSKVPGTATTNAKLILNLDATKDVKVFDLQNPEETSDFHYSLPIVDSAGVTRIAEVYFNKTAVGQWEYHAIVDGKNAEGGVDGQNVEMATGALSFNDKGQLQTNTQTTNTFTFKDAAAQNITFDFGTPIDAGGDPAQASTQFGTTSSVSVRKTDGAKSGDLAGVNFNEKGILTASYTNGELKDYAQLALGKFTSTQGLKKMGKNLYKETLTSGQVSLGKPGENGRGVLHSGTLEVSNVDSNAEMIEMLRSQRNFNASSKAFSTVDEMIKNTIDMKS